MVKFELENHEFVMVLGLMELSSKYITQGSAAWEEYQQLLAKLRSQGV